MRILTIAALSILCVFSQAASAAERILLPGSPAAAWPARNLVGWWSTPAGPGPFPAVVLLHGCGGAYDANGELNARHRQYEALLREAGYAVLQLDSFSPRGLKSICSGDKRIAVRADRRPDALVALAWLAGRPDIVAARIGLIGWSNGASTVLAVEEGGAGAALRYKTAIAFYPDCRLAGGPPRPDGPLLILAGAADDWAVPARCDAMVSDMEKRGLKVERHLYPGAFHDFDWPGLKLHKLTGLNLAPGGVATQGEDPVARVDALQRVLAWLAATL